MRRSVQDALAPKTLEVPRVIVDQIIGIQDTLVPAENYMTRRNEWEMSGQPVVLSSERSGHFHGGRTDEDLILLHQPADHLLAIRHDIQIGEEVPLLHDGPDSREMLFAHHVEKVSPRK